jgi:hypothetical protein
MNQIKLNINKSENANLKISDYQAFFYSSVISLDFDFIEPYLLMKFLLIIAVSNSRQ